MDAYYTDQIITYMGNKRKVIPHIEHIIQLIQERLGKEKLTIGEGFSGSGVVSRLFKNHASELYTNDLAGYSNTINKCYLANPDRITIDLIAKYIEQANIFVINNNSETKFIQLHWSPKTDTVLAGERAYFTKENGRRIDSYQEYIINQVPADYQHYLLAPLLVEASKHNNCSGNFAAFYKKDNIGHFGGKNENDLKRITQNIELPFPLFSINECKVSVSQKDVNVWIKDKNIPELDLVYYDPPYNKHPYHIYYFLLDLINKWDTTIQIPNTFRGQPKEWQSSLYNSHSKANNAFEELIKHTRAKYILVSYNNEGIISNMKEILSKYGVVTEKFIEHSTYNRMKGIADYKRNPGKEVANIKECLYLLEKTIT